MGMVVRTNVMAMNANRQLGINNNAVGKSLEKLSSGFRINRAADDASGLAISEKMKAQIKGLETAAANSQDGISLVQTAEGGAQEIHDMLNRMVELATKSANGTIQDEVDREAIQREVDDLNSEITRIAKATNFNGINLLDGNLAAKSSGAVDLSKTGSVDFSDGVTVTAADGKGAIAKSTLKLDKPFSASDTITLNFNVPDANGNAVAKSITLTHQDAAITSNDTGLTFTGKTADEQMASIVARLQSGTDNTALGGVTLASVFGGGGATEAAYSAADKQITFTATAEGAAGKYHLSSATVNNVDSSATNVKTTAGAAGTAAATNAAGGVTNLGAGALNYQAGDKLKFDFTLNDGNTASAIVELTADMLVSGDTATITENIANKLKTTNFEDNAATKGFDESSRKVSDFFDVKANAKVTDGSAELGSLQIGTKHATSITNTGDLKLDTVSRALKGTEAYNTVTSGTNTVVVAGVTAAATGTAAASVNTVTINANMAVGDQFKLEGTLADGRTFSVMLEAGSTADPSKNQFAIGADADATAAAIRGALTNGATKVEVSNADGSTSTVSGADIFGTGAGATFAVGGAGAAITLTNNSNGVDGTLGLTGSINSSSVVAESAAASSAVVTEGVDQTAGSTKISFKTDELEYGTAVTVGTGANAKTFELVQSADAATTQAGNVKVVIADLANATESDIADALKAAIDTELATTTGGTTWAAKLGVNANASKDLVDNSLTLTNTTAGSASKAVETKSAYGESKNVTIGLNKDADGKLKLKAGDTLEINGKTYQFDTDVRNVKNGNNFIKVADFNNAEDVAKAIKLAVETDDATVTATINDDNSVTLSGKYVNGSFASPKVSETLSGGGLTLQIGDTGDDFNHVTVSVDDLSAKGIGTDGLNVSHQDNAKNSIDVIKAAINQVSTNRANLGSLQNRLEHTINNLDTTAENMTAANSRIRDTDMAKEMMNYTKMNVLQQAAQAMLAQANQAPQSILQLLQ